ncbi:MAG: GNAT family N-acetyltransferase [Deinococcus sp.]|nr:GNAT family N-acetyltransferase [Deinococcus sp.]
MHIRPVEKQDRAPLAALLAATENFTPQEVAVALELIDSALEHPEKDEYWVQVAEEGGPIVGYVCYGPTPMTDRTFDLYWVAVHPSKRGQGIGKALTSHVEALLRAKTARLLLIETASKESYQATRRFYLDQGYREVARIKDFYADGDDRVIYAKRLDR